MITVTIHHDENRHVSAFEFSGHAEYDQTGKDLVCAGASTIAIGTVNAIYALLQIEPKIDQATEGGGYLRVDLPTDLNADIDSKLQLIVQVMTAQVYSMVQNYGQYIQINYNQVK
ncbi:MULTISPECIES: ribosomal-processing cysteine protease Prp [Lysinibacillus]|uniref:Ribosomal processing cysteine protease Prp n=1 Tax=Lysinibacillus antri TaxID=2498145 RepID=A0A3S0WIY7_9BACI|nr:MULTISPECIES: ribosomal-processing cysteine protease Prp [Lysinibacillus]RUL57136.1 ribosomal-processing cysteine protease Prp [Lysinibacillus antri]TSI03230.1 ribosomal-processing cysteine protease Prp [Lysinibacillus sp. BW-2-10]